MPTSVNLSKALRRLRARSGNGLDVYVFTNNRASSRSLRVSKPRLSVLRKSATVRRRGRRLTTKDAVKAIKRALPVGKIIGSGSYGTVFEAIWDGAFQRALKSLTGRATSRNVFSASAASRKSLPSGSDIVVKIDCSWNKHRDPHGRRFIRKTMYETAMHRKVERRAPEIVPRLLATMHYQGLYISIMERIDGRELYSVVRGSRVKRAVFHNLSVAMKKMWLAGVVHLDMHYGNVLVKPNNDVFIIDFGFARAIPDAIRRRIRKLKHRPVDTMFDESGLGDWLQSCHARAGKSSYKSNIRLLQDLATYVR